MRNDPWKLHNQFDVQIPISGEYSQQVERITWTYQLVRYFSQQVTDDVFFYYGAVSSCILPVFYALLGAFASLLRKFENDWKTHTWISSGTDSARFTVAIIGGAVVGLFSTFIGSKEVTVSPLAVAFLVGYSVDAFFHFIENLIQYLEKPINSDTSGTQTAASSKSTPTPSTSAE